MTTALDEEHVLQFPDGIPGFATARRFVLSDLDDSGVFQVLQSVDEPELSMVVCVPWLLFPDYQVDLGDEVEQDLELDQPDDAIVFCTVTVDTEERAFHVNLLGPFVVNARTRRGRQVVLAESGYNARETVHLENLAG